MWPIHTLLEGGAAKSNVSTLPCHGVRSAHRKKRRSNGATRTKLACDTESAAFSATAAMLPPTPWMTRAMTSWGTVEKAPTKQLETKCTYTEYKDEGVCV